jgi:hypothetical protein
MHNTQTDGSLSIAQIMMNFWKQRGLKIQLLRGNNNRIARVATVHNWLSISGDDLPYWLICKNCHKLIETLPELVHDENRVDDVDTDGNDHGYDSVGYFLMSVKFKRIIPASFDIIKKQRSTLLPSGRDGLPFINPNTFFK